MDPAALAGLCLLLAQGRAALPSPAGLTCPGHRDPAEASGTAWLAGRLAAPGARDGIARVAYAEAGNQGDSGLAAVVYTILNRLQDGRWGASVDAVLNGRAQFEPVMRAGGDWRGLAPVSSAAQARIDTILDLALDGRLPDLTHGARYFQNPAVVAQRAADGQVSKRLVDFGGQTPSAVIGAHRFYAGQGRGGGLSDAAAPRSQASADGAMFVGENRAGVAPDRADAPSASAAGDPGQALFVSTGGQVGAARR